MIRYTNANNCFNRKRGYKTKSTIYILFAMLMPFVLSSAYWALRLADLLIRICFLAAANPDTPHFSTYITLFNSIILMNVSCSNIYYAVG